MSKTTHYTSSNNSTIAGEGQGSNGVGKFDINYELHLAPLFNLFFNNQIEELEEFLRLKNENIERYNHGQAKLTSESQIVQNLLDNTPDSFTYIDYCLHYQLVLEPLNTGQKLKMNLAELAYHLEFYKIVGTLKEIWNSHYSNSEENFPLLAERNNDTEVAMYNSQGGSNAFGNNTNEELEQAVNLLRRGVYQAINSSGEEDEEHNSDESSSTEALSQSTLSTPDDDEQVSLEPGAALDEGSGTVEYNALGLD
jgi:hypothetical protein